MRSPELLYTEPSTDGHSRNFGSPTPQRPRRSVRRVRDRPPREPRRSDRQRCRCVRHPRPKLDELADGDRRGLATDRLDIGTDVARGSVGEGVQIDVAGEGSIAGVDREDLPSRGLVRRADVDVPIEPTGTQQRVVEEIPAIRRRDDHHVFEFFESVEFGEQLRDDAFAHAGVAAGTTAFGGDRVDFVEEDDRWCVRSRLLEDLANALPDSPTYLLSNSGPLIEMKLLAASLATTFASSVFPVPGGPYSNTPVAG